ncbi:MAG TPA: polyprenyl synthetase family protein [Saprospiraceae bacterium]|nr:polyprenyl synthetase family protein [Saprospiraceae bacterium]HMQ83627.1 polyprenyl synthetase family protein [Saprospiraceae bacterium]
MSSFQAILSAFESYCKNQLSSRSPEELYAPVEYIMQLGGKRIRPILAILGRLIFDEEAEPALPVALAVELFHNFSLIHDDIMDEAPLRRGQPTVHLKYGINSGILSGDVMLIQAYDYLLEGKVGERGIQLFNRVAREVCEGQQYDMNFESRTDVQIPEYLQMIELKTAALLGGSLALGAMTTDAPSDAIQLLEAFGRNIGIAFQLQDDILDTFGDPSLVGKKVGGDIAQNKKTYLILKALELAAPAEKARLLQLMGGQPIPEQEKIAQVSAILRDLNIQQLAEQEKNVYQNRAFENLYALNGNKSAIEALSNLAQQLMQRQY